ncbi:flagellar biosynthetic protein FliQ [Exiguobacterium sp. Leaf187]|jgi:flagellar biosynthetic protein FliQ|uniref:Flagellar biosynthetic protein FliQ n=2 Tax=Exiguobacterium TaxID=33986 RepID=A0A0V8GK68_9BACL|nr:MULTISPECIES: flagellar biosynthesis protein FliQ [Exiguobacterium]AHA30093.1 flagellar biosynthesis protein FliQ [Exiguobacterium sp. MH3]AOT01065.1 EscS/YscS/HrcS family type III secretion system export apparatus protein [Exiguobacterium sp. U13-1]EZP60840.1 Flagellar biosynthesis protein FliQ [Exiguobacterium sp. RIT341]KNH36342.1 flagellar biosynthesis protein FliQ [Exiguobacterium acetylicum]KOP29642.1 flagellar biosynthesis protein FliQ [Exiguobacterium sp. BMC-KP]
MTQEMIIQLASSAVWTLLKVSAPLLLVSLVVGLLVSILQATTQIQEQTLSFVPKIVAVFLALVFFGPWIMQELQTFTIDLFKQIAEVSRK